MPLVPIAIAAVAVSAVSTGYSIYAGQQAAGQQQKAAADQQQADQLQAARQSRDAIRTSRIAASDATQNASNQGATSTSAAQGGVASIQSQMNSNLSFLDQYNTFEEQGTAALGKAATFRADAQTAGQIGGLADKVFDATGQTFGSINKAVFGG